MTTLKERIDRALTGTDDKESVGKYLDVIRSNLRDCTAMFDRRVQTLIIAIIGLELIAQAAVSEVSFAGIKLSDLNLVQKLLPCVIAYLYYSLATVISYRRLLEEVHDRVTGHLFPAFLANNLEFYGHPPTVFHLEKIIASDVGGRFGSFLDGLTTPLKLVLGLGPAVYVAYAECRLFALFGAKDLLVWISFVVTLLLVVHVFLQMVGVNRVTSNERGSSDGNRPSA
jgi:hypothetical protein